MFHVVEVRLDHAATPTSHSALLLFNILFLLGLTISKLRCGATDQAVAGTQDQKLCSVTVCTLPVVKRDVGNHVSKTRVCSPCMLWRVK